MYPLRRVFFRPGECRGTASGKLRNLNLRNLFAFAKVCLRAAQQRRRKDKGHAQLAGNGLCLDNGRYQPPMSGPLSIPEHTMPKTEIPRKAEGTSSSVNVANVQDQGKPLGTTYAASALFRWTGGADNTANRMCGIRRATSALTTMLQMVSYHPDTFAEFASNEISEYMAVAAYLADDIAELAREEQ